MRLRTTDSNNADGTILCNLKFCWKDSNWKRTYPLEPSVRCPSVSVSWWFCFSVQSASCWRYCSSASLRPSASHGSWTCVSRRPPLNLKQEQVELFFTYADTLQTGIFFNIKITRKHSSRMRTARLPTIFRFIQGPRSRGWVVTHPGHIHYQDIFTPWTCPTLL